MRKHFLNVEERKVVCMVKKMGGMYYCDYLCMTGSMRPCPADKCTVYKRKKKNKQFIGGID